MSINTKRVVILACMLTLAIPLYAQNEVEYTKEAKPVAETEAPVEKPLAEAPSTAPIKEKTINSFLNFINKEAYAAVVDKEEEKRMLREKWKELLKIDIFYPYFKAKEIEDWVSDKAKIEFFNIKGRPKFEDEQIKYIFKAKF